MKYLHEIQMSYFLDNSVPGAKNILKRFSTSSNPNRNICPIAFIPYMSVNMLEILMSL